MNLANDREPMISYSCLIDTDTDNCKFFKINAPFLPYGHRTDRQTDGCTDRSIAQCLLHLLWLGEGI